MKVESVVHRKDFMDGVLKKVLGNSHLTALHVVGKIQKKLSVDQPVRRTMSEDGRPILVGTTKATQGDPPRILYGRLRQSIDYEIRSNKDGGGGTISIIIGAPTNYALSLEKGNPKTGSKHPFMVPTIKEEEATIRKKLFDGIV